MNTNIWGDFQICISVLLTTALINFDSKRRDNSSILGIDKSLLDMTFDQDQSWSIETHG